MEVLGSKARGAHQGVGGGMGNGWSQRAKGFTPPRQAPSFPLLLPLQQSLLLLCWAAPGSWQAVPVLTGQHLPATALDTERGGTSDKPQSPHCNLPEPQSPHP